MRGALASLIACWLGALALAPAALADYGAGVSGDGAELVSADYNRLEQGDDSTVYAAVSADGRYVVIQTRARNFFADDDPDPVDKYRAGGLFRFEIASRELEKVAGGDLFEEATNSFLRRGASNPSVSADGRFVAFATAEPLVAADGNGNVDVYVRDMAVPEADPGAFDLVSARDGGNMAASYGPPPVSVPGSDPGADVSRGVAISADGRYVAFRTDVASDLPASGSVNAGSGQVFLRDRQLDETVLVTRTDPGGQPAGGALGASLSADGTTVAWTGSNAPAQTRFLNGELVDSGFAYYMWQRVADGPSAPTKRITGVADPDDPGCPPAAVSQFDQTTQGPCFGPLTEQEGLRASIISQVPALSADGYTVAYLTGSGPRPLPFTGPGLDLFMTDMHPGISRKQGTTELTRDTASTDLATSAPIGGLAMAADGRHLVIATARTTFLLNTLVPTGPSRTVPGTRELYVVDVDQGTLDRVARSYVGEDINGDVQAGATISADGGRVAFTSFAGNLFYGDANQRPDAFLATRQEDPEVQPPPPPPPPPPPNTEEDRLVARTTSQGDGSVVLRVEVPAAGGLKAVASGRVGKPRSKRALASGTARAAAKGWVEIPLRVVERYRHELKVRGRIKTRTSLDFVYSVGGRRIGDTVEVVFKQRRHKR